MARTFSKLSREARDAIGPLYNKEPVENVAKRHGISEAYVRTIQWKWCHANKIATEGRKRKIVVTGDGTITFGQPLDHYLSDFKCEPPPPDPITAFGVTLLDKHDGQCCWPIGIDLDGERRFCGKLRYGKKSYCGFHYTKSLARSDEKPPEAYHLSWTKGGMYRDAHEFLEAAE